MKLQICLFIITGCFSREAPGWGKGAPPTSLFLAEQAAKNALQREEGDRSDSVLISLTADELSEDQGAQQSRSVSPLTLWPSTPLSTGRLPASTFLRPQGHQICSVPGDWLG